MLTIYCENALVMQLYYSWNCRYTVACSFASPVCTICCEKDSFKHTYLFRIFLFNTTSNSILCSTYSLTTAILLMTRVATCNSSRN